MTCPAAGEARNQRQDLAAQLKTLLAGDPGAAGRGPVQPSDRRGLFISEKTASVHVSNILAKLGVDSRIEPLQWRTVLA